MIASQDVRTSHGTVAVAYWDSPQEALRTNRGWFESNFGTGDSQFSGSLQQLDHGLLHGDKSFTKMADALLDRIDLELDGFQGPEWLPSVMGAYPMVPDAIAGHPEAMRLRKDAESNRAPVRLFMSLVVSAGVSPEQMARRGAAIGALVRVLSNERPVELWAMCDMHSLKGRQVMSIDAIRITTTPIDAQSLAFITSSKCVARGLAFGLSAIQNGSPSHGGSIHWIAGGGPGSKAYETVIRQAMRMEPQDVLLPGGYLTEGHQMMNDPVGWVRDMLAKARSIDEQEDYR